MKGRVLSKRPVRFVLIALFWNFCLNFSILAASECPSLAKLLLREESGLSARLVSKGFEKAVAERVEGYVHRSLDSLGEDVVLASIVPFSRQEFTGEVGRRELAIHYLRSLKMTHDDEKYRFRVVTLLDRKVETFSWQEWVDAVDGLVYLGGRYGHSQKDLLVCSSCVDDSLSRHGHKFALKDVLNLRVQEVLEYVVPNSHQKIDQSIVSWMKMLGLGQFSTSGRVLVAPEERRSLALFLALALESSPANQVERKLIDAIVEVSRRPDGRARLVDTKNFHRLWILLGGQDAIIEGGDTSGNALMQSWTEVLVETAAKGRGKIHKGRAFHRAIRDFAERAERNFQQQGHVKVFQAQKQYLFPQQGEISEKLRSPYRGD